MAGFLLSLIAFLTAWRLGRRDLGRGIVAVLVAGYLYGVLRARFLDSFTHFTFDAGVAGLYAARFLGPPDPLGRQAERVVRPWVLAIGGWCLLLVLVPYNHPAIQLVGLRGAVWYLPFVLLGARLSERDTATIASGLTWLNLVAFGVALIEYRLGLESVMPRNSATFLMYISSDVGDGSYRIPATFANAHAYAYAMVASMPWVAARWRQDDLPTRTRALCVLSLAGAALGSFMAGTRTPVVILFAEVALIAVTMRTSLRTKLALTGLVVVVGLVVASESRMQRFLSLGDTEKVAQRVGSVGELRLLEVLIQYPAGTGLGSAFGTSVPFFLQEYAPRAIGIENELGRIALEQTPLGLALWMCLLALTVLRRARPVSARWQLLYPLARLHVALAWATSMIGTGLLLYVPSAALLCLNMGALGRERTAAEAPPRGPRPRAAPRRVVVASVRPDVP